MAMLNNQRVNSAANLRVLLQFITCFFVWWTFRPKTRDDADDVNGFLSKKVEPLHMSLLNWQCQGGAPVRCRIHSVQIIPTLILLIFRWKV
jgi:hypothetical protein